MPEARSYRIREVVGRGGAGTVFRAELRTAEGVSREIALKFDDRAGEAALARVSAEVQLLARVQHRALVRVEGLVRLGGRWAVVMEHVDGASLDELLARGPMPPSVVLQVAEEIASGLWAAYQAPGAEDAPLKMVHRDVKPGNVMLTRHGEAKLLDFGLARVELETHDLEATSTVWGTLPWLAPERLDHEDLHAGDVFALALTLVQLLTGRLPEQGPTADPARHRLRILEASELLARRGVPNGLVRLTEQALAWEPAARPDAREFARGLRALRGQVEDVALPDWAEVEVAAALAARPRHADPLVGQVLGEDGPRAPAGPSPSPVAAPRPRRRRSPWRMALVVWLVALGGLSFASLVAAAFGSGFVAMFFTAAAIGLSDADACVTQVVTMREELEKKHPLATEPWVDERFTAYEEACLDERLGWFGAMLVGMQVAAILQDGVVDDGELGELDQREREWGVK